MISKLRQVIFFLVILSIPNQLGFHFWPPFSYINGVRIDYLSPTLYLSDLFIVLLFVFFLIDLIKGNIKLKFPKIPKLIKIFSLLFVLEIVLALFFAASFGAHVFGVIKILEFVFLSIYTANIIKFKNISYLVDILSLGGIVASALSIMQFFSQSSIGGIWYFLGERTFNLNTIGISSMNINGDLVMRPYAAFPHPNVLAFFMLFVLLMASVRIPYEKNIYEKIFLYITFAFCTSALFFSFSRLAILCFVIVYGYIAVKIIMKKTLNGFLYGLLFVFISLLYTFNYYSRFLNPQLLLRDILFRIDLLNVSLLILRENVFLGVGLNNFFIHQAFFQKNISATLFQPVHNIFILTLVEVGIFASFILPLILFYSLKKTYKHLKIKKQTEISTLYKNLFILILCIIFIGSFDHFFLTVQQGMLMFSVILGIAFSNIKALVKEKVAGGGR